jgi:hypothetical protein
MVDRVHRDRGDAHLPKFNIKEYLKVSMDWKVRFFATNFGLSAWVCGKPFCSIFRSFSSRRIMKRKCPCNTHISLLGNGNEHSAQLQLSEWEVSAELWGHWLSEAKMLLHISKFKHLFDIRDSQQNSSMLIFCYADLNYTLISQRLL